MISDSHRRLDELMQREIDAVGRLRGVLEREQSALKTRRAEEIEQVTVTKQGIVAELEKYGREREGLLKRAGFSPDRVGFMSFLESAGAAAQHLNELWGRLREDLKSCQAQNLVNGQILEANRRSAEHALAILVGQPAAPKNSTYNRNGYTSMGLGNRTFAKA